MGGYQPLSFRDVLQFVPSNWTLTTIIADQIRRAFPSENEHWPVRNNLVLSRLKILEAQGHVMREREHSAGSSAMWAITAQGKAALDRGYV